MFDIFLFHFIHVLHYTKMKTIPYVHFSGFTCLHILHCILLILAYHNDPKFSDRLVWANSADPDQTVPRGAVWSGSSLLAIPFTSLWPNTLRFGHFVWILGRLQQSFVASGNLGTLRCTVYVFTLADSVWPADLLLLSHSLPPVKWALFWENWSSGFPTESHTNQAVQPQKMARGLKFLI